MTHTHTHNGNGNGNGAGETAAPDPGPSIAVATAPADASDPVHSRALLVSVSISTWTARKYDKRVTREINARHGADRDAGRYNKLLLPGDAEPYRDLIRTCNAARSDHYANTLPWTDAGWRLLPSANYMHYANIMREHSRAFADALDRFVSAYPELREAARAALNGMYRDDDYPTSAELRHRFGFDVEYSPLPTSGDFRLDDLPADAIAEIRTRVQDRVERATADAVRDAWDRLHETVEHIRDRLADPDAIFRNSLVDNARELVDVLARLNVTNDPELERIRARVAAELTAHDPQTLRDAPDVRSATADAAGAILDAMADVYGPAGAGGQS